MYEFKVGDTGKTRNGVKFTVIAFDPDFGETPLVVKMPAEKNSKKHIVVLRRLNGQASFSDGEYQLDLLPQMKTIYLNIYKDMIIHHDTEEKARSLSMAGALVVAHPVEVPQS